MDGTTWIAIAAIALAALIGIALIYLLKKKIIKPETITQTAELLDGIEVVGSGFIQQLAEYAKIAVHAVEQLAKQGVIEKNNDTKKKAALEYVQTFAKIDDVSLSPADLDTADVLIEAAVNELPHTKN